MLALSWIAAVVACLGFGSASVLQSIGAQRVTQNSGASGLARILVQGPYLVGLAADGIGFVANVVALQRLPLFLVESIISGSVGVTALLAAARGHRHDAREWVLLGGLGVGLVLVAVSASTQSAVALPPALAWAIFASCAVPALLGLAALSRRGRRRWVGLAIASGLGFSGVAIASRGLSGDRISWSLLADPLLWTIVVAGGLGLAWFALSLQSGPVTTITALTFVMEMIIPGAVGLWLLGDSVQPGREWAAALGFALAIVGTVGLARYAE